VDVERINEARRLRDARGITEEDVAMRVLRMHVSVETASGTVEVSLLNPGLDLWDAFDAMCCRAVSMIAEHMVS
jgi:hypothetical protein